MAFWLFKQEPATYSFTDLEQDGRTVWDGVKNPLALKYLREVQPGDRIWFYHTGKERAIVGEMRAVEPEEERINHADLPSLLVVVIPIARLPYPVTLASIKADEFLVSWELIRLPRLSVVPSSLPQWQRVEAISRGKPA